MQSDAGIKSKTYMQLTLKRVMRTYIFFPVLSQHQNIQTKELVCSLGLRCSTNHVHQSRCLPASWTSTVCIPKASKALSKKKCLTNRRKRSLEKETSRLFTRKRKRLQKAQLRFKQRSAETQDNKKQVKV